MPSEPTLTIRTPHLNLITLSIPFSRFAPLGRAVFPCHIPAPTFIAVGNRATAICLSSSKVLLLNPIPLTPEVRAKLEELGGVHYVACDLGHHLFVAEYVKVWPECRVIGVRGLEGKRRDVRWDFLYGAEEDWLDGDDGDDGSGDEEKKSKKLEDVFGFADEVQTVYFEGFITRCVAWYHKSSKTLVTSDLLMNLPCTEQYSTPTNSSPHFLPTRLFSRHANPTTLFFKSLIYYIATVDSSLMRRDAKKVAEWDIERIIPCHGDVIEETGGQAWGECYAWFLGPNRREWGLGRWVVRGFMEAVRWVFLL